ncbi:hypothetical protein EDB89DRAFT_1916283 [Lactarius sanguifluus]|nr:hypothetical protein EDB89DRAFT_1916283 [Lactarius sanguifluus]
MLVVTPPNSNTSIAYGTPVHTRSSTTGYLSASYLSRDQIFRIMSREMAPFFLGPMPPQEFISTFLPGSQPSGFKFEHGMFDPLVELRSETLMYRTFIEIVQPHLKTIYIRETSHSPDKALTGHSVSFSPDCTVYDEENKDITENNSALSDLFIEFKNRPEEDAFSTHFTDENPTGFMSQKTKGVITAGQITTYAALQLDCQYRTHVFSVLIVRDYAWLIRWDRSGAIVTAPIYYQQDPALLDFFTRYDNADRSMRGHDDSVRYATQAETRKAIDANKEFSISQKLLVVNVPLQRPKSGYGSYVIKPPAGRFYTPPGRATRTSIAYDIERNCIVFFKDSWRVDCDGIKREGEIYAMLNDAGVPNVPRCSASGDVGEDIYHSTRWKPSDAVRTWILHRDISPNNILLTECSDFEGGLLIDWDLCKLVDPDDPSAGGAHQPARTGTWQFMAADLIVNPKISHTFIHDIESAFFVLLWMATHYVQAKMVTEELSGLVNSIFNPQVFGNSGGPGKLAFMRGVEELDNLIFRDNTPLGELLSVLKELLAVRHRRRPDAPPSHPHSLNINGVIHHARRASSLKPSTAVGPLQEEENLQKRLQDYNELHGCPQRPLASRRTCHKAGAYSPPYRQVGRTFGFQEMQGSCSGVQKWGVCGTAGITETKQVTLIPRVFLCQCNCKSFARRNDLMMFGKVHTRDIT